MPRICQGLVRFTLKLTLKSTEGRPASIVASLRNTNAENQAKNHPRRVVSLLNDTLTSTSTYCTRWNQTCPCFFSKFQFFSQQSHGLQPRAYAWIKAMLNSFPILILLPSSTGLQGEGLYRTGFKMRRNCNWSLFHVSYFVRQ